MINIILFSLCSSCVGEWIFFYNCIQIPTINLTNSNVFLSNILLNIDNIYYVVGSLGSTGEVRTTRWWTRGVLLYLDEYEYDILFYTLYNIHILWVVVVVVVRYVEVACDLHNRYRTGGEGEGAGESYIDFTCIQVCCKLWWPTVLNPSSECTRVAKTSCSANRAPASLHLALPSRR